MLPPRADGFAVVRRSAWDLLGFRLIDRIEIWDGLRIESDFEWF